MEGCNPIDNRYSVTTLSVCLIIISFAVNCFAQDYPPYEPEDSLEYEPPIFPEDDGLNYDKDDPFLVIGTKEEAQQPEQPPEDLSLETSVVPNGESVQYIPIEAAAAAATVWYWNIVEIGINAPTGGNLAADLGINFTQELEAMTEAGISLESGVAGESVIVTAGGLVLAVATGAVIGVTIDYIIWDAFAQPALDYIEENADLYTDEECCELAAKYDDGQWWNLLDYYDADYYIWQEACQGRVLNCT